MAVIGLLVSRNKPYVLPPDWLDEDIDSYIVLNNLRIICAGFPPIPIVERTQRVRQPLSRAATEGHLRLTASQGSFHENSFFAVEIT